MNFHDLLFEPCGRSECSIPQSVAIGVNRVDGDVQELGDLGIVGNAEPDDSQ